MKYRKIQSDAIDQILNAIRQGKTDIFVEAPTGSGKSLIALELSKKLNGKSYILTSERSLQAQYESDCQTVYKENHKDTPSISGIDNYQCHVNKLPFSLGACKGLNLSYSEIINTFPCSKNCEYIQRQIKARQAKYSILNYSYFLIQMNYVLEKHGIEKSPFKRADVVICDEAHKLPDIISNHFACNINESLISKFNDINEEISKLRENYSLNFTSINQTIRKLIKEPINHIVNNHKLLTQFYEQLCELKDSSQIIQSHIQKSYMGNMTSILSNDKPDLQKMKLPSEVISFRKFCDHIKDIHCKVEDYLVITKNFGLKSMVIDENDSKNGKKFITTYDSSLFKQHFKKYSNVRIYMSATLQSNVLIGRWKLNPDKCEIIKLDPQWDPSKSPIYLVGTESFTFSNTSKAIDSAVKSLKIICENHENERGIIHTTSYFIRDELFKRCDHSFRFYTYNNTQEKIDLLNKLKYLPKNSIIVGPSLFEGTNFENDLGKFNVIIKVSYPNIKNPLWKNRYKFAREVYLGEAASRLEQASGRASRHEKDESITYILDTRANKFCKDSTYFSKAFRLRIA